jgi:hypothetical protein
LRKDKSANILCYEPVNAASRLSHITHHMLHVIIARYPGSLNNIHLEKQAFSEEMHLKN